MFPPFAVLCLCQVRAVKACGPDGLQICLGPLPAAERAHLYPVQGVRGFVGHREELAYRLGSLLSDELHVVDQPLRLARLIVEAELRQHSWHVRGPQLVQARAFHQALRRARRQRSDTVLYQLADTAAFHRGVAVYPCTGYLAVEAVGVQRDMQVGGPCVAGLYPIRHVAELGIDYLKAAARQRGLQIVAQAAIATIGTSAVLGDVNWLMVTSASVLAGILSLLTSVAGLPELEE